MADGDAVAAPAEPWRWREAIDNISERTPVTREVWDALEEAARLRAFTVSGLASVALVSEVHEAITRAVAEGTTLAEFKAAVGPALEAAWGKANAPRLETIFRTNVQTAYNAARHAEMSRPAVRAARPFWRFVSILDGRTTETCAPLNNVVRPVNDPFWQTSWPPLHFNCRSTVVSLSRSQAAEAGGVSELPEAAPPGRGFGASPNLVGEQLAPSDRAPPAVTAAYQQRQPR